MIKNYFIYSVSINTPKILSPNNKMVQRKNLKHFFHVYFLTKSTTCGHIRKANRFSLTLTSILSIKTI